MQDEVTCELISITGGNPITIGNWTSYDIERDYFTPADAFTFTLEDDRADQLNAELQIGMQVNINVNNNCIMVGFVDSFDYTYSRQSGKKLVLRGRDLLGVIDDATIFPNLGTGGTKDFQFAPSTTLDTIFNTIFTPFGASIAVDDAPHLTLATAFAFGRKANTTKTPKGLARSLKTQLGHLKKPNKGEKFLGYALRFCTLVGAHIKMAPGTRDTILINCPTYNRSSPVAYNLQHISIGNNPGNNIEDGKMHVSYKEQPSALILEGTTGAATFKKQNFKVVSVNEITGYDRRNSDASTAVFLPAVNDAISQLTTGIVSSGNAGTGYYLIPMKEDLYNSLPNSVVGLQTAFYRPEYMIDESGKTGSELQFTCAKRMAQYQQKYFALDYKVSGHTQMVNGSPVVWMTNTMCNVIDDTFDTTNSLSNAYWIEKVTFSKGRSSGTSSTIKLNLPNIYAFDIQYSDQDAKAAAVKRDKNVFGRHNPKITNNSTGPDGTAAGE
jgi:prophage tail gpP-like protein